ncbi:MAG: winged helix-turn-helix domain-containing protein [Candidatus Berkelbacteria bacterium]|nr:winged helix-turn-helix domain-containing protein [Candidatus Berkelbacteria bacterium]
MDSKNIRTLERVFKGAANHWRIKILFLISENPGITLDEIVRELKSVYQTTSEHTRRLRIAGLINKNYRGKTVAHELSPFGKKMVKTLRTFLD